jgi:hypothetical protein
MSDRPENRSDVGHQGKPVLQGIGMQLLRIDQNGNVDVTVWTRAARNNRSKQVRRQNLGMPAKEPDQPFFGSGPRSLHYQGQADL